MAKLLAIPGLPEYVEEIDHNLGKVLGALDPVLAQPILRIAEGGKRLRPILVIAVSSIHGGKVDSKTISSAVAVELAHLASLVHDDIIDNHKLRHDQPTIFTQEGSNTALLAGDCLLALSCAQIAELSKDATLDLTSAIVSMCEGQALELSKSYARNPASKAYIEISRKKTAALFAAACQLGAHCANLPTKEMGELSRFGEAFGIFYQIIDDIKDGDIKNISTAKALEQAEYYCGLTASALNDLDSSRQANGLASLPKVYLSDLKAKLL